MAGVTLKVEGLQAAISSIKRLDKEAKEKIKVRLNEFGVTTKREATRILASGKGGFDTGSLAGSITPKIHESGLKIEIVVAKNYAAYVEFGTKKFAAQQVAKLPPDWKAYAATFKGKGTGTMDDFILNIMEWVRRKGIAGTYSVKTRKRTGNKAAQPFEDADVAYAIALSILRNGTRAHPFLFPAFEIARKELVANLLKDFK